MLGWDNYGQDPQRPHIQRRTVRDAGWPYAYWVCAGSNMKGFGKTPKEAYGAWVRAMALFRG